MTISRNTASMLLACGLAAMNSFGAEGKAARSTNEPSSRLWLQYDSLTPAQQKEYSAVIVNICCLSQSAIMTNARSELQTAVEIMTGRKMNQVAAPDQNGTVLLGTAQTLTNHLPKAVIDKAKALKDDGFMMESIVLQGKKVTVITSISERGVLYGVFHFVRRMQTGQAITALSVTEQPAVNLRMLNHWDDLNGHIERGYAGKSLWKWDELPAKIDPRYREYARFCASIGINATVLNNVNADPRILRSDYLAKIKVLADVFRPWGIRVFLSANYAAPMEPSATPDRMKRWGGIGNLKTADPLNPDVQQWWAKKADEIYTLIPDFGGFLVKADSEGMPGPRTYKRNHAEGANMLAKALKPHGGVLLWRAFVYGKDKSDRAKDVLNEFKAFDGKFDSNVFVQVKNGPLDFQPREPFSPLFGMMPRTDLALELQITKEYLGQSTTLAYLAPMWSEVLQSDTYARGKGSTVARVIDGTVDNRPQSCIAGVANTGDDADWCGNIFNQANWYAFGRLAWNDQLSPEYIADEWIRMTFHCDAVTRAAIKKMMMGSYEAYVDYTMPLGLNFLGGTGDHYDPAPAATRKFHKADNTGVGFDRTKTGSNYVGQYRPEAGAAFTDIDKTPLKYLLWFHHVPWQHQLASGRSLWEELNVRYDRGVAYVDGMITTWKSLDGKIDAGRHKAVMAKLENEKELAINWRKTCLNYFSGFACASNAVGQKAESEEKKETR